MPPSRKWFLRMTRTSPSHRRNHPTHLITNHLTTTNWWEGVRLFAVSAPISPSRLYDSRPLTTTTTTIITPAKTHLEIKQILPLSDEEKREEILRCRFRLSPHPTPPPPPKQPRVNSPQPATPSSPPLPPQPHRRQISPINQYHLPQTFYPEALCRLLLHPKCNNNNNRASRPMSPNRRRRRRRWPCFTKMSNPRRR